VSRACRFRSAGAGTGASLRLPGRWGPTASPLRRRPAAFSWSRGVRSARSTRPPENSAWSRDLEGEPIWVGYLADRIIAATRTRLVALSLDKGLVEWQYDLGTDRKAGIDPFAKEPLVEPGRDAAPPLLKDFRIVGNRIFCLRGEQALLAFDGDTGQLDWSYSPSSGRINPHLLVGQRRIVLQVLKPNVIQVLNTVDGSRRAEFPQAEEEGWPRDPLAIDDDHVALVADRLTVSLFDTTRGSTPGCSARPRSCPATAPLACSAMPSGYWCSTTART